MPVQTTHRPRKLHLRDATARRGFTLVELLVVLVIIAIIGGMIVVGITSVIGGTRDDSTESRMEMLDSFLAAYANAENARAGGQGNTEANELPSVLRVVPNVQDPAGRYSTVDSAADDLKVAPQPGDPPFFNGLPLTAPKPTSAAPYGVPPFLTLDPTRLPERFGDDNWIIEPAVARTQAVLRRLLTIPANQSTFDSLPADAKTRVPATSFNGDDSILAHADPVPGPPTSALNPALVVDGHGNPIIFVPATGLTGLIFEDGTRVGIDSNGKNVPPAPSDRLVAVHGGPFWASAGADGIFCFTREPGPDRLYDTDDDVLIPRADDNVYSTEVMVKKVTPP